MAISITIYIAFSTDNGVNESFRHDFDGLAYSNN